MTSGIATGTRLGPYEIVGWIGAGGMGEVYRARDTRLGRDVALKLIPGAASADPSRLRRFEQEARAAAQLSHPNILVVYDVGQHGGLPYIVSELLEGESLRARLQKGAIALRKAIEYARQAADALAAAHERSIVHRDVKPDNLFITSEGRIKILDFGIAKLIAPEEGQGRHTGYPTDTTPGTVVGTAAYMSPEQIRGETADGRSDIFSLGLVLDEMLTGRAAFLRATTAETMTAILNEEIPELDPAKVSPALARTIGRCVEKSREARFQSARDLAFGLDVVTGTQGTVARGGTPSRWRPTPSGAIAVLAVAAAGALWVTRPSPPPPVRAENPLSRARFSSITSWPGTETGAEISPDGRYAAFIADRAGEFDLWITQIGTDDFRNLTTDVPSLLVPGPLLRTFGFSDDGSEIWFTPDKDAAGRKFLLPIGGGAPRGLLGAGDASPAWSPDGLRLAYMNNRDGDPLFVSSRSGADPKQILDDPKGHNHNPAWSPDNEWIYYAHGAEPTAEMEIWRTRPDASVREQVGGPATALNFLTVIDPRTVLYVARDRDQSGPWLWWLDIPTHKSSRVITALDRYTHLSASRDGRRIVAATSRPTTALWRVPILDDVAGDRDLAPFTVPTPRALAPRFRDQTLFYLSNRGIPDDGLWRLDPGDKLSQVWNGMDAALSEPAAISRDGFHVAVVIHDGQKRHLMIMDADGTHARTLAPSIDILGQAGQGAVDWSPDGRAIVAGGVEGDKAALFLIPIDAGQPVRLVDGAAACPVWSPDGTFIVYAGAFVAGQSDLLAVRPNGARVDMPPVRVRPGAYRFLPDSKRIVYLRTNAWLDFRMLDLVTKKDRDLTRFTNRGEVRTFDVTPDGKFVVFDRATPNSDIILIDLPKPGAGAPGPASR